MKNPTEAEWDAITDVKDAYREQWSRLIGETLSAVPPHCRQPLLTLLGEMSVYATRYEDYVEGY